MAVTGVLQLNCGKPELWDVRGSIDSLEGLAPQGSVNQSVEQTEHRDV